MVCVVISESETLRIRRALRVCRRRASGTGCAHVDRHPVAKVTPQYPENIVARISRVFGCGDGRKRAPRLFWLGSSLFWLVSMFCWSTGFGPSCEAAVVLSLVLGAFLAEPLDAPAPSWNLIWYWFISFAPVRGGSHFLCCCKESNQRKQLWG